ncbi:MAG: 50S ribosomal protein L31 [Planctomycetaceae bacterium]
MKKAIHPNYVACAVKCACGNTFQTRATVKEIKVDICNVCHPYYTGKQKFVDTAGRVQKFQERYAEFEKRRASAGRSTGQGS